MVPNRREEGVICIEITRNFHPGAVRGMQNEGERNLKRMRSFLGIIYCAAFLQIGLNLQIID